MENEVLWIEPTLWRRVHCPEGFPFQVLTFLGRDGTERDRVWVRGVALDIETGRPLEQLTLCVPATQQRAEPRTARPRSGPSPALPATAPAVPAPPWDPGTQTGRVPPWLPDAPPLPTLPDASSLHPSRRPAGQPPIGYCRVA